MLGADRLRLLVVGAGCIGKGLAKPLQVVNTGVQNLDHTGVVDGDVFVYEQVAEPGGVPQLGHNVGGEESAVAHTVKTSA